MGHWYHDTTNVNQCGPVDWQRGEEPAEPQQLGFDYG
jgi:hypothetical protein